MLINQPLVTDIDYAPYGCNQDNLDIEFDDQAAALADNQCNSSTEAIFGIFKPTSALSDFNGDPLNGTWRLTVVDNSPGVDSGILLKWCLVPNGLYQPNSPPVIKNESGTAIDSLFVQTDVDVPLTVRLNVTDANTDNVDIFSATSLTGNGTVDTEPSGDTSFILYRIQDFQVRIILKL